MFSSLLTLSTLALAASSALGATHTVLVGMNTTKVSWRVRWWWMKKKLQLMDD